MSEETPETQTSDQSDDWAAAKAEQGDEGTTDEGSSTVADDANSASDYERAEFKNLNDNSTQLIAAAANLDVILDIPVTLSMEIGRTELPINSLLQLNQGSVVELDRLAGEPMDVLINGTLIAHGEVVVINEKFGIRLTDVISPAERVKKLK